MRATVTGFIALGLGCAPSAPESPAAAGPDAIEVEPIEVEPAGSLAGPALRARAIEVPAGRPAAYANLAEGADGRAVLTWIEETGAGEGASAALHLSFCEVDSAAESFAWSEPVVAAAGERWFVNWVDVPGAAVLPDGTLFVHWFEQYPNPEYTTGYYAFGRLSRDDGASWSKPFRLHSDRSPVEHGFVTAIALDATRFAFVWLDGRAGSEAAIAKELAGAHAPMGLYFRTLDTTGRLGEEVALDERVCDCCSTDVAVLEGVGPFVVYRDREDDEVRDISSVRRERAGWAAPEPVGHDGWTIAGCPVNGPALCVQGRRVALVRYTEGVDSPRPGKPVVLATLSKRAGEGFETLGVVDDGDPLGRVDAVWLPDDVLVVSWLEKVEGGAEWRVRAFSREGEPGPALTVAATVSRRAAGVAHLARHGDAALMVWTDVDAATIRTAEISLAR